MKWLFVFLCLLLFLAGCVSIVDDSGRVVSLFVDDSGKLSGVVEDRVVERGVLRALVKGSVYESGETVSVFGTCLDDRDQPVNGTYALLSAWYPNGTSFLVNFPMQEIQNGYYLYTGPMNAVRGTYLTEFDCRLNGSNVSAKAFGEWQNPYWVARINETQAEVRNITIQIGNFRANVTQGFEITWDKIESVNATLNETFSNLSQQIYSVGQIANDSVDRNDSYIVRLLQNLTLLTGGGGSGNAVANISEEYTTPVFLRKWSIKVWAYDSFGGVVAYPDVRCNIETNLPSAAEMVPFGDHFTYSVLVTRRDDLLWNVSCVWV